VAKVEKKLGGKKIIALGAGESALVFATDGIHQVLSKRFKRVLSEAQETRGASLLEAFDKCKPENATKVVNDFVLIQLIGQLAEMIDDLQSKK
jgi:pyruvate/2-oxoacid:ferredoxin oxidoreductase beta subunit